MEKLLWLVESHPSLPYLQALPSLLCSSVKWADLYSLLSPARICTASWCCEIADIFAIEPEVKRHYTALCHWGLEFTRLSEFKASPKLLAILGPVSWMSVDVEGYKKIF